MHTINVYYFQSSRRRSRAAGLQRVTTFTLTDVTLSSRNIISKYISPRHEVRSSARRTSPLTMVNFYWAALILSFRLMLMNIILMNMIAWGPSWVKQLKSRLNFDAIARSTDLRTCFNVFVIPIQCILYFTMHVCSIFTLIFVVRCVTVSRSAPNNAYRNGEMHHCTELCLYMLRIPYIRDIWPAREKWHATYVKSCEGLTS